MFRFIILCWWKETLTDGLNWIFYHYWRKKLAKSFVFLNSVRQLESRSFNNKAPKHRITHRTKWVREVFTFCSIESCNVTRFQGNHKWGGDSSEKRMTATDKANHIIKFIFISLSYSICLLINSWQSGNMISLFFFPTTSYTLIGRQLLINEEGGDAT